MSTSQLVKEYYLTNYTKCNISYGFLATWEGLAYPCHIIQAIALPLQTLTFYLLWKKTPMTMKAMKWPLLINHFWASWLDLIFCSLVTPYVYLRFFGFIGFGLFTLLGVPILPQVILGVMSCFCMMGATIYVFESRSSYLQQNRFRISRKCSRIIYHSGIFFLNCCVFLILLWAPEDQEFAKLEVLKQEPCPTPEFFKYDMFILTTDLTIRKLTLRFFGPGLIFHGILHILFHVTCTVYYLFLVNSNTKISMETRKIQKKFFIGTLIQTMVPLGIFMVPIVGVLLDQLTNSFTQDMMNLAIITIGLHGILESISIVIVHRFYRRAVWELVTRRKIKMLIIVFLPILLVMYVHAHTFLISILGIQRFLIYFFNSSFIFKYIECFQNNNGNFIPCIYASFIIVNVFLAISKLCLQNIESKEHLPFQLFMVYYIFLNSTLLFSALLYVPVMISIRKYRHLPSAVQNKPHKYIFYQTLLIVGSKAYVVAFLFYDLVSTPVLIQSSYIFCSKHNIQILLKKPLNFFNSLFVIMFRTAQVQPVGVRSDMTNVESTRY